MAQTKHLSFLVLVSCLVATFSFYKVDTESNSTPNEPVKIGRGISSESDPVVLSAEQIQESVSNFTSNDNDYSDRFLPNTREVPNDEYTAAAQHVQNMAEQIVSQLNSCPSGVNAEELCRLPKSFIPAELFQKCCKGASCLTPGKQCSRGSQCCSGMCSEGICAADRGENRLFPEEVCTKNSDCFSNICDYRPNSRSVKICYGDNTTNYCSRVTQSCKINRHCCSNSCSQNRCIGSHLEKSPIGYPCSGDHSECMSGYCSLQTNRCE